MHNIQLLMPYVTKMSMSKKKNDYRLAFRVISIIFYPSDVYLLYGIHIDRCNMLNTKKLYQLDGRDANSSSMSIWRLALFRNFLWSQVLFDPSCSVLNK